VILEPTHTDVGPRMYPDDDELGIDKVLVVLAVPQLPVTV
jgi:hypothetical protein